MALSGALLVAQRRRQAVTIASSTSGNADAGLGGNEHGVGGVEADDVLDLLPDALGLGRRQVDLFSTGTISWPASSA